MRPLLSVLSFLAVLALAFWAYRENYATQRQLKQMSRLQDEIAGLRDEIAMQKAEWAYLNRPERLRDLAAMNFDRLGLMPITPAQLGTADRVAMAPPPPLVIKGMIDGETSLGAPDISATTDAQGEQIP